jgi:long-chain acyl-CoA synthetase
MLYETWRRVARNHASEPALSEPGSGRSWTFAELAALTERADDGESPVVYPRGNGASFVFSVLRAWRGGRVICPIEPDQARPAVAAVPTGCVHVKLTSASTGAPRLIGFTAEQLAADAQNIVATMGLRSDWPNLGVISLAHSYGFSNLVLPLLLQGIPLSVLEAPLPESVRLAVDRLGCVTLPAVPAMWRAWHDANAITPKIRLAISAGAPLPISLERAAFESTGVKIRNFYGASECGGIAFDDSARPRAEESCVGRPLNNVTVSRNAEGCLEVRSAAVGQTYWPEADETLSGGCFRTSDLVEIVDGRIHMRGRATDLVNVAGRKVSPENIERALRQHPAVRECLVFGVPSPDAARGETIVACVDANGGADAAALKQHLLQCLPAWQAPREWWFVDSLRANSRGKFSRSEWRRRYLEGGRQEQPPRFDKVSKTKV